MPVTARRAKIAGNPLLGVFARCTDEVVIVPPETGVETREIIEKALKVPSLQAMAGGSSVIGSLICGNSIGFVTTNRATDEELKALRYYGSASRLPTKVNAAGNIILANDDAALVHPGLSVRACATVAETLGVKVLKGTIGGLKTVGMAGVATNKGVLVHPRVSEAELVVLEDLFGLPVDVGTVNFGTPLVGSGLLANSQGYIAGEESTGPELGRIEDALGFLD